MTAVAYVQGAFFGLRVCPGCGTVFEPNGSQRYCKPRCRHSGHPEQVPVPAEQVESVRRIVRLNLGRYWKQVAMKKRGACGAVAQVLYKHGWGRIASCWLSYTGRGNPPTEFSHWDSEPEEPGPYDEWLFHWVNINKFSGVIDVVGLPGRELCIPVLRDLRVIDSTKEQMVDIVEDDGYRRRVRPRWPRKDLQFWEKALESVLL